MYKKVLLPVDGREGAWRALRAANQAIKICSGEIVLLHVEPAYAQIIGGKDRQELQANIERITQEKLAPVVNFLEGNKIKFSTVAANGDIADAIIRVAYEQEVDLVVMFTDGVSSFSDMVLGTTTQQVLKGIDVDLLSVRR